LAKKTFAQIIFIAHDHDGSSSQHDSATQRPAITTGSRTTTAWLRPASDPAPILRVRAASRGRCDMLWILGGREMQLGPCCTPASGGDVTFAAAAALRLSSHLSRVLIHFGVPLGSGLSSFPEPPDATLSSSACRGGRARQGSAAPAPRPRQRLTQMHTSEHSKRSVQTTARPDPVAGGGAHPPGSGAHLFLRPARDERQRVHLPAQTLQGRVVREPCAHRPGA